MKKLFLFTTFTISAFAGMIQCGLARQTASPPNIVLIYMDDMGYGDVDAYGGIDYITPNIDRLAARGMRFTSFYSVQPICSASRAAILTGCYIRTMKDQDMLTTWYTQKAVKFINAHKGQPFFLYLAHSMVHVPLAVSDQFRGKSKQGLFGDVMMEIDWSVGQVMKALRENGLERNTLVIFTADNGPWLVFGNHAGSAGGLREGKMTAFEGGQREPAIMSWPGVIPPGTVCNKLAANIDILPTLAAVSGAPLPVHQIDGVNILSLLKGEKNANPRDHLYYYYHKNSLEAVREGPWKLVLPHDYLSVTGEIPGKDGVPGKAHKDSTGLALYDLRRDPGERYDVKEQHPAVVERMQQLAEQAREDLGDDLTGRPGKNRRPPGK